MPHQVAARCVSIGRMRRSIAIASILIGLHATAATAAPPWSPPENASSPAPFIERPDAVFDSGGRAYATWRASGRSRVSVREPGAVDFGPERAAPGFVTPLRAYGFNRVLGLDLRRRNRAVSLRGRLSRSDGSFSEPDTIATYTPVGGAPSLAAQERALAAWTEAGAHDRQIVRVAIRRPGRQFGDPVTLRGQGRSRNVVAAAGVDAMFVAWERAGIVEARVRLTGKGWGPVREVGRAAKGSNIFSAAFSGSRGYLAWLAESSESSTLRAAVLPSTSARFRSPQNIETIDRSAPAEPHAPVLVPSPGRIAALAWTGWDGAAWRVRVAVIGPEATFVSRIDASPPGEQAVLGDADSIPAGTPTVVVLWSRLDAAGELGDRVRAALGPFGGAFGAPEDVSDLDRGRLPAVAFDNNARRLTAIWSQRIGPDQPGVPLGRITTFARSSTRPG
jgi:hypothetical protein